MPRPCLTFFALSLFATAIPTMFIKPANASPIRLCTREEVEASLANLDTPKDCTPQAEEEIAQLRACSQIQMPETLNLMAPVTDPRLLKCVPDLEQVNSLASSIGGKISGALSNLSGAEIGNEGKYELTGISYNIAGKEIKMEGVIRARHVFGEIKEQIPVPVTKYRREQIPVSVTRYKDVPYQHPITKYRKERVPVPGFETRRFKECALPNPFGGCFQWIETDVKVPVTRMVWKDIPYPSVETRYKKVPYPDVEMQWKEVPYPDVEMQWKTVQPPTLSATCNFTYLVNITTTESTPTISCGQGGLGNLTLNASAIARVLNGEVPSIKSIVSSLGTTPPGVVEKLDDTYDRVRAKKTEGETFAYFSSRSFVEWASTKNLAVNIVASAVTGGALSSQLMAELEGKLISEFFYFSQLVSERGATITFGQFLELVQTGNMDIPNFGSIKFEVVNVPLIRTTCIAGRSDKCSSALPEPRIGFVLKVRTN